MKETLGSLMRKLKQRLSFLKGVPSTSQDVTCADISNVINNNVVPDRGQAVSTSADNNVNNNVVPDHGQNNVVVAAAGNEPANHHNHIYDLGGRPASPTPLVVYVEQHEENEMRYEVPLKYLISSPNIRAILERDPKFREAMERGEHVLELTGPYKIVCKAELFERVLDAAMAKEKEAKCLKKSYDDRLSKPRDQHLKLTNMSSSSKGGHSMRYSACSLYK